MLSNPIRNLRPAGGFFRTFIRILKQGYRLRAYDHRSPGPCSDWAVTCRSICTVSVRGIAEELHARGIRAPRGDTWHPTTVSRLLSRLST
ncbi:recombinase family protein [Bradyrhizobium sp. 173]|nr:recombinase family protein [Bradyrhizobium sp. 173]MCK1562766.1 recombinase family protein [Bradyrhizobium sp. 173]